MKHLLSILFLALIVLASCEDDVKKPTDTLTSGEVTISVDETYQPIIREQLQVFDSSYPDAHIKAIYQSESQCFKDFLDQKARVILVTRLLTAQELAYCESQKMVPDHLEVARDAIAVILHPSSLDTQIGLAQLRGILTGQYKKKYTVVFDNSGSSMIRYVQDSVLKGEKLGDNVYAAGSNDSVIAYVQRNEDAIGLVGLGYVSTKEDETTGSFTNKVRVAAIQNEKDKTFYKPYQAYIALQSYPLSRNLYYIKNETYPGLGRGFTNFLIKDRGQLIFKQSSLFPLQLNIVIRDVNLNRGKIGG